MHTIHNIAFEVDVNYDNSLVSWEQYYVDFFQERLLPRVERMCDDWDKKHPNTRCIIDEIDIDVEVNDLDLETLQKEIIQQISQQLNSIQADGNSSDGNIIATITKEASPFDALISYLHDGILPGYISVKVFKEWLGTIIEFTSVEKNKLTTLFANKKDAIERMLSLLRNDYEKFSKLIESKQEITSQFIKLETTFFQQFLKVICTQFKLTYKPEEVEIWFKTLGFSSSLPQFSKTFMQLLTPKAQAENKRFKQIDELQLTVLVLQAITQYEQGESITIKASKIATIVNDDKGKAEAGNVPTITTSTKNTSSKETAKNTESKSQNSEDKHKIQESNNAEKATTKEFQTTQNLNDEAKEHPTKTTKETAETTEIGNDQAKKAAESNLAKAHLLQQKAKEFSETTVTRKSTAKDMALTTEKAGLILLHPFLLRFFEGVGLLSEDKQITDIGKACMLLHFLATETEEVTDIELTLEKILLGIPLETIINYQTPLTEKDKNLCEELLLAVLEHWVVLKKSTINTLRDMFLKREGNLTVSESNIKLKIERAAQDILLERVPWNISLIRLKWMEKMMHVEW
ncbi:contractile injection system tape measure protein [uncultured Kordia sp.]|uniref:contractile injection system tape measure protein n=1 Tax=uncultured Kordia sp. TaxID=507699 RepID=UPI002611EA7F|nr:contractile injection system tape measure protein [uncultured Kordia sp.]